MNRDTDKEENRLKTEVWSTVELKACCTDCKAVNKAHFMLKIRFKLIYILHWRHSMSNTAEESIFFKRLKGGNRSIEMNRIAAWHVQSSHWLQGYHGEYLVIFKIVSMWLIEKKQASHLKLPVSITKEYRP